MHVDLGTNVDGAWTKQIAVSYDGNTWAAIYKDNLTVKPIFVAHAKGNRMSKYRYDNKTRIILEDPSGDIKAEFELQDVENQSSWSTGTKAGLQAAVNDLSTWIST